jgi:hypothetical protein
MITARTFGEPLAGMQDAADKVGNAVVTSVTAATSDLTSMLRAQVSSAGLGSKLAQSWRQRLYDNGAAGAAGYVWSQAPIIIEAFDDGATIIARHGRWLAIATDAVPKGPRGRALAPLDLESRLGQALAFVQPAGSRNAFLFLDPPKPGRRLGAHQKPVLMFVLVPQVTLTKRLDIAGAVVVAEGELADFLGRALPQDE